MLDRVVFFINYPISRRLAATGCWGHAKFAGHPALDLRLNPFREGMLIPALVRLLRDCSRPRPQTKPPTDLELLVVNEEALEALICAFEARVWSKLVELCVFSDWRPASNSTLEAMEPVTTVAPADPALSVEPAEAGELLGPVLPAAPVELMEPLEQVPVESLDPVILFTFKHLWRLGQSLNKAAFVHLRVLRMDVSAKDIEYPGLL